MLYICRVQFVGEFLVITYVVLGIADLLLAPEVLRRLGHTLINLAVGNFIVALALAWALVRLSQIDCVTRKIKD